MISIIVCSRFTEVRNELSYNIKLTIGVEYELIVIDNSHNKFSIFSAYNEGVRLAKYPYLCFMHDDILYHTQNWGEKLIKHFENPNIGLIGVVGGHYMPKCPASWWSSGYVSGKYIQGYLENNEYKTKYFEHLRYKNREELSINVAVVDGIWFCIPKYIFQNTTFDSNTFNNFHHYDTDICFQILNHCKEVKVVFDILIEHKSRGFLNEIFHRQRIVCYDKWKDFLPKICGIEISENDLEDRLYLVNEINNINIAYINKINDFKIARLNEIEIIKSSFTYKLGAFLTKPFIYIQNKITNSYLINILIKKRKEY